MKLERFKNFVIILHDKTEYVARIQIFGSKCKSWASIKKKPMNQISFNQEVCLKPYVNMNTMLMNNVENDSVKTMEDIRKHRDIKPETSETRTNYLGP